MATAYTEGEQTLTRLQVDNKKVIESINDEAIRVLRIHVAYDTDGLVGELNGELVKAMESKNIIVEISTPRATYSLPASEVNMDQIRARAGEEAALEDIKVFVKISDTPSPIAEQIGRDSADKGIRIVAGPVDFEIVAAYGDQTFAISAFSGYVERSITIPEGIDGNRISTGVIVDRDGTLHHVPTKIVERYGQFHAIINSLGNSTYSVVWNPKHFADTAFHWAEADINEMGARMIIEGLPENNYGPEQDVTRAEFTAIVARALGLRGSASQSDLPDFLDVSATDWFAEAVATASGYKLIDGYADGTFRPANKITRAEALIVLVKALNLVERNQARSASDASAALHPLRIGIKFRNGFNRRPHWPWSASLFKGTTVET